MVNFRAMPPVDPQRRKEQAPKVTKLLSGARFEFLGIRETSAHDVFYIIGRYLDAAGEWCQHEWDNRGRVRNERFFEFGLDWATARHDL